MKHRQAHSAYVCRTLLFLLCLWCTALPAGARRTGLSVLQWNVWQEGTQVTGGYEAIVDEIVRLRPDFVTLSEVRNYHQTNFAARIVESLRQRGEKYSTLRVTRAALLAPSGYIVQGRRTTAAAPGEQIPPLGVYPSDHLGLFVCLERR